MEQPEKNSFSPFLLISGSALVVLGVLVFVVASWSAFPAWARIVLSLLPPLLLYSVAWLKITQTIHPSARHILTLAASLTFPLSIGALIYQSGYYTTTDTSLFFLTSLVSTIWFLWLMLGKREKWHNWLLIIASLVLLSNFLQLVGLPSYVESISYVILAYFYLSLGWYLDHSEAEKESLPFVYIGLLVGLIGCVTFTPNWLGSAITISSLMSYLLISALLFLVAILYSQEWQKNKRSGAYMVRRTAEIAACLTLTVPLLFVSANTPLDTATLLCALLIAIGATLLSLVIRIKILRFMGFLSLIFTLLPILSLALNQVTAFWPLLLLVAGFILIALAFLSHHPKAPSLISQFKHLPKETLWGLGIVPEISPNDELLSVKPTVEGVSRTFSIVSGIIFACFILYLLFILIGFIL